MSEIFFDPSVTKQSEALLEYLVKIMEISFSLMVTLHGQECEKYNNLLNPEVHENANNIQRTQAVDQSIEIPDGCRPEDSKVKWLFDDMNDFYKIIAESIIIEQVFGKEERLIYNVFTYKFSREYPDFLKSHLLRKLLFSKLVDRMIKETNPKAL